MYLIEINVKYILNTYRIVHYYNSMTTKLIVDYVSYLLLGLYFTTQNNIRLDVTISKYKYTQTPVNINKPTRSYYLYIICFIFYK